MNMNMPAESARVGHPRIQAAIMPTPAAVTSGQEVRKALVTTQAGRGSGPRT